MAITEVVLSPAGKASLLFPVSGAGANIPLGTPLMRGATGGTNKGVLIPVTATSNAHVVGLLGEKHVYGSSGDALTATLVSWFAQNGQLTSGNVSFPSHPIEWLDTGVVARVEYSLASTVAVASASSTSIVVTSFEDNFDGGFLYVNAGTGIGQLFFVQASSSGTITIPAAPTVALDTTSKLTKIMPYFLDTPVWKINTTTQPTTIDSTAATGTGRAVCLGSFIQKGDGIAQTLDPKAYSGATGLSAITQLVFWSYMNLIDTVFHPVA